MIWRFSRKSIPKDAEIENKIRGADVARAQVDAMQERLEHAVRGLSTAKREFTND